MGQEAVAEEEDGHASAASRKYSGDAKQKKNKIVWVRKTSSEAGECDKFKDSIRVFLQYRQLAHVKQEPDASNALNIGVASYEDLGISADENLELYTDMRRKTRREKQVAEMSEVWTGYMGGAEWTAEEAQAEVMAALCADPARAAAAEMWPPFAMPPEYMWGEYWGAQFLDTAWAKGRADGPRRILPKDRTFFEIKKKDLGAGKDARTTVMVRNLTKSCTHDLFAEFLGKCGLQDRYTFLYLPSSRGTRPCGLAFVDFKAPKDILTLLGAIEAGTGESIVADTKDSTLETSYARLQGLDQLAHHFGHTAVLLNADADKRPRFITAEESSTEDSETTKGFKTMKASAREFVPGQASVETTPELSAVSSEPDVAKDGGDKVLIPPAYKGVLWQVEYYFSVDNLCQDCYLRSLMDSEGWVKLADLERFPRLHCVGADAKTLAWVIAMSKELELSPDKDRVRSNDAIRRQTFGRIATLPSAMMPRADGKADAPTFKKPKDPVALAQAAAARHAAWIAGWPRH